MIGHEVISGHLVILRFTYIYISAWQVYPVDHPDFKKNVTVPDLLRGMNGVIELLDIVEQIRQSCAVRFMNGPDAFAICHIAHPGGVSCLV